MTERNKAAIELNKHRYGDDYYQRIGHKGGSNGRGEDYHGGFAYVAPGQEESNGKRFGVLGGYLTGKSRKIALDDKLRTDEINELLKLGIRTLGTLRMQGLIDVVDEHKNHVTLYTEVGRGNWPYVFKDCGIGPQIIVAWASVLSAEIEHYRTIARNNFDSGETELLSKEERARFKIIRNLAGAFKVATDFDIL